MVSSQTKPLVNFGIIVVKRLKTWIILRIKFFFFFFCIVFCKIHKHIIKFIKNYRYTWVGYGEGRPTPLHLLCGVDKTHPLGLGEAGTCRKEFKLSSLFLVYKPYLSSFKFKVLNIRDIAIKTLTPKDINFSYPTFWPHIAWNII